MDMLRGYDVNCAPAQATVLFLTGDSMTGTA